MTGSEPTNDRVGLPLTMDLCKAEPGAPIRNTLGRNFLDSAVLRALRNHVDRQFLLHLEGKQLICDRLQYGSEIISVHDDVDIVPVHGGQGSRDGLGRPSCWAEQAPVR